MGEKKSVGWISGACSFDDLGAVGDIDLTGSFIYNLSRTQNFSETFQKRPA